MQPTYLSHRSINAIHIFSRLACVFTFIEENLYHMAERTLCWCPVRTRSQRRLSKAITKLYGSVGPQENRVTA